MGKNKDILSELGLTPSKKKGQNYLTSEHDAKTLVRESGIRETDIVIEIGPGLGAITKFLLESSLYLHAIEIENKVGIYLLSKFKEYEKKFSLYIQDFRNFDPAQISENKLFLVSNVPYVYSTDVIMWMISNRNYIHKSSLLLQKEFADRVCANPGTKAYGSLSIYLQLFYNVRPGIILKGTSFFPQTSVDSRQVHFVSTNKYIEKVKDIIFFEKVLRASFSMRRKMLMNCLLKNGLIETRSEGEELFSKLNIDIKIRAESLSIEDFIELSNALLI